MLILDLQAELDPQYIRFESFYGQPFVFCLLHNFGGTLGFNGAIPFISQVNLQCISSEYVALQKCKNQLCLLQKARHWGKKFPEFHYGRHGANDGGYWSKLHCLRQNARNGVEKFRSRPKSMVLFIHLLSFTELTLPCGSGMTTTPWEDTVWTIQQLCPLGDYCR